ncbi:DNA damage-inducible transcript 4-like protein-like [Haplochromis burtoni]|uniref:DNA damage-inducible transcript 4-like protein n=1 Tax=Haplochromis burtoni TaxID=8153 RepID=A0A3Q2UT38_HAPBU|nr:DNA damage-inducible transcript 4-like protein-like [Haplochromis burtoni]
MVYSSALVFGHLLSEEENVVEMIGKCFCPLKITGQKMSSSRRGSVESYEESESISSFADLDAGLEHEQRLFQQVVTQQMERRLTEAKASILNCQVLLLPRHMTTRISQDVVRASADEPCGLRGASIKLYIDGKDGLKYIGSIFPDSSVTPTFELSVVFKAESDGWPSFKNIFDGNKVLKLRPEYRLVKRKLYSSASPVVHDFN